LGEANTAYQALGKAISYLQVRETAFAGLDETREIDAALPGLQAEQVKVREEIMAFLAGEAQVLPPTDNDYNKVHSLSDQLDTMNANQNKASQFLDIATQIAATWSKTRP
jgi:hypothetical protein